MVIQDFPDPRDPRVSTPEGIIALGGDLDPESLILAYSQGIFPWPIPGYPLAWFCPPQRAILEWDHLHIPKSLLRAKSKSPFRFSIDQDFESVISACAQSPRPGQNGTWITRQMQRAYIRLHQLGFAHSIEAWNGNHLVGGIYGVDAGGAFAGESMFYKEANASKLAILFLMEYLHSRGLDWMDIQTITPHMKSLGARELPRDEFLTKLEKTRQIGIPLF